MLEAEVVATTARFVRCHRRQGQRVLRDRRVVHVGTVVWIGQFTTAGRFAILRPFWVCNEGLLGGSLFIVGSEALAGG